MKYLREDYARSLVAVITEHKMRVPEIAARLIALTKRNGDFAHLSKILREVERLVLARVNARKVVLESARPLTDQSMREIKDAFAENDVFETKVRPELIAGAKITVNGEWVIDATLQGRLRKLFK